MQACSYVILPLALVSAAFAASSTKAPSKPKTPAKPFTVKVDTKGDPQVFMTEVAARCLSSPESKVVAVSAHRVEVTDTDQACAKEMQHLGAGPDVGVSVHAKGNAKADLARRMSERYPDGLRIEVSKNCPCVVFKGERARDAAQAAMFD